MPVPPEAVWEVLARPESYGYWVVGSKVIRDVEGDWPEPGARFHHTVGVGPLKVSDHTRSLEAEPPFRLRLRARALPLGIAIVELELEPVDGGTRVSITENPSGVYAPLALLPAVQISTRLRNAESLMRLEELALGA
jgi:uncharacterized protein YndB with AHSA1/START domain